MNNRKKMLQVIGRLSFTGIMALITLIAFHLNNYRPGTGSMKIALDDYIPFNKYFIFPYVYWFLYVAVGLIILAVINKKNYFRMFTSIVAGMLICYVIYYFYPSTVPRPIITSNDLVSNIVKFIYSADKPYNCFPSIHVLNSFFISIFLIKSIKNKNIHVVCYVSFILITLSTLFVKQHYILDAVSAIILGGIIYFVVMAVSADNKTILFKNKEKSKLNNDKLTKTKYEAEI